MALTRLWSGCRKDPALLAIAPCLLAAAFALGVTPTAEGTPILYTFTGLITSVGAGRMAGIPAVGAPVQYTFLVDLNAHGMFTAGGHTTDWTSSYHYPGIHYFYDRLVSGSNLIPVTWGSSYMDPYAWNVGYDRDPSFSPPNGSGSLDGSIGNYENIVDVTRDSMVETWRVGDSFRGVNRACGPEAICDPNFLAMAVVGSDLTLSSMTSVPEPSALCLLGAGLVLIGRRLRARRL